jgi:hypothetical protein
MQDVDPPDNSTRVCIAAMEFKLREVGDRRQQRTDGNESGWK